MHTIKNLVLFYIGQCTGCHKVSWQFSKNTAKAIDILIRSVLSIQ